MTNLPESVQALIDQIQYDEVADNNVSRANIRALCATVKNSNPVYWDPAAAQQLTGGELAPAAMLSTWTRPERWSPDRQGEYKSLQLHHDLKALLAFPHAIVSSFESVFFTPVMEGDQLRSCQVLRSITEEKTTRLGHGRFWLIEVQYFNQHDELVGEEHFNCFAYRKPVKSTSTHAGEP